jgi:hypothetical protein
MTFKHLSPAFGTQAGDSLSFFAFPACGKHRDLNGLARNIEATLMLWIFANVDSSGFLQDSLYHTSALEQLCISVTRGLGLPFK